MNWELIGGIAIGLVLFSVAFYLFSVVVASYYIYTLTLKRKNKEQWNRTLQIRNELTIRMDEIGVEWQKENDAYRQDVHIVNDGLNLYGEYYDYGFDKAVVILSGRTDSLRHGYYYAKPYVEAGCNVLVIDSRAHGCSDGEYVTLGFEESKDDLAWVRFLHERYGMNSIVFHSICIGAAGGLFAITSPDCPDYVKGLVAEGMFANFGVSMRRHLIERKKLMFPVLQCIDFWAKKYTGHSMMKGPIDVMHKMDKPLLMLHGEKDTHSIPENARKLYERCPSSEKRLVMFDEGAHSMLRITDTERYDAEITAFLNRLFQHAQAVE